MKTRLVVWVDVTGNEVWATSTEQVHRVLREAVQDAVEGVAGGNAVEVVNLVETPLPE